MVISIRLPADDEALLTRAAELLQISKSEFVRRSIAAYAAKLIPTEEVPEAIDAMYIGQGGGLRQPQDVASREKRAILERLREKHGYAG
ncbi:MAG: ribbon-helix-helix protein, CopG family [Burkholderiaceae bacterium]